MDEAAFASAALVSWIARVGDAAALRNRVVHAIALDQCLCCGKATMFRHPYSGDAADRTPEAVASVLARYDALRVEGLPLDTQLSEAVNQRIFVEAKKVANTTDEIQYPPQIYPNHVEHRCAACLGDRGSTIVHIGTAIAVVPAARWQAYRDGLWPPREVTYRTVGFAQLVACAPGDQVPYQCVLPPHSGVTPR